MSDSQNKQRLWILIAAGALILLSVIIAERIQRPSFGRLTSYIGFDLPKNSQLIDQTSDIALFDFSQSWLVQIPSHEAHPWETSDRFHECSSKTGPTEDYAYILSLVRSDFPSSISHFQHPRIWRGGLDGNCYIASSDNGLLVFFRYFRT